LDRVGWLARVTNSGPWKDAHALGATNVPVVTWHPGVTETSTAGEPIVHWAPVGPVHWQGVHARWSSMPVKNVCGPVGYSGGHAGAMPACITQARVEKGAEGAGAHTSPAPHPAPEGTTEGAQARAICPQLGSADVSAPPVEPQVPPLGAGLLTVTLWAAKGVVWHEDEAVTEPIEGAVQALSAKKDSKGPAHVTTEGVHEHVEQVGVGLFKLPYPSNADVPSKPAPHGGAAPWFVAPT
jgi:hypothetical protein